MTDILVVGNPTQLVSTNLDQSFSLAASAGCGKTHILIQRVLALLENGIPIDRLLLLTFTENAAREMRRRLSQELVAQCDMEWANHALENVAYASIQTLNSFAYELCSTYFVEAGLGSQAEIADDISYKDLSKTAFDQCYNAWGNQENHATFFSLSSAFEITRTKWRDISRSLERLVPVGYIPDTMWSDKNKSLTQQMNEITLTTRSVARSILEAIAQCDLTSLGAEPTKRMTSITQYAQALSRFDSPEEIVLVLAHRSDYITNNRFSHNKRSDLETIERHVDTLRETIEQTLPTLVNCLLNYGTLLIIEYLVDFRTQRFEKGVISHDESLVLASSVLENQATRFDVWNRYDSVLIDEFQDTDDVQISIVQALIESDGQEQAGRLFVVGDTKQSIYGFRGAQVKSYENFVDSSDVQQVALDTSYRSVDRILDTVNTVMTELIESYRPMKSQRLHYSVDVDHVTTLGSVSGKNVDDVRKAQAHDIVSSIPTFVGKTIHTRTDTREAALSDIAILVRTGKGIPDLVTSLEEKDIAYRVDSSELIWDLTFTKMVIAIVSASTNPRDHKSIVATLKSPLYRCTNDDLAHYADTMKAMFDSLDGESKKKVEREQFIWNYVTTSGSEDNKVARALSELHKFHRRSEKLSPTRLLADIMFTQGLLRSFSSRTGSQTTKSISHFLTCIAINFEETHQPGSSYDFSNYLVQMRNHRKAPVKYIPPTTGQAVHIMTIHKSKGLEFPVVFLASSVTEKKVIDPYAINIGAHTTFTPQDIALYFKKDLYDSRLEESLEERKEERREEEIRLLYVGMTRAQDFLILCAHDQEPPKSGVGDASGGVRLLTQTLAITGLDQTLHNLVSKPSVISDDSKIDGDTPDINESFADNVNALKQRIRHGAVLTPSSMDIEQSPTDEEQGSYLTPELRITKPLRSNLIGTATHRALNLIDFDANQDEIDRVAFACAAHESIPENADDVSQLISRALSHDIIANSTTFLREIPISGKIDGHFVEGYIDLLVKTKKGWLILDYKTDTIDTTFTVESKIKKYAPQLSTYTRLLKAIHNIEVCGSALLFLRLESDGFIELSNP